MATKATTAQLTKTINDLFQAYIGKAPTAKELATALKAGAGSTERLLIASPNNLYGKGIGSTTTIDPKTGAAKTVFKTPTLVAAEAKRRKQFPGLDDATWNDVKSLSDDNITTMFKWLPHLDPAKTGVDTSKLTAAELAGFENDAELAIKDFYNKNATNAKTEYDTKQTELKRATDNTLQDLGIQDTRLREDISKNIARTQEDRDVQLGVISRNFLEGIRQSQNTLENQGLTFSGEAIRQIGDKAGLVAPPGYQGEAQVTRTLQDESVNRAATRDITDANTALTRNAFSLAPGTDLQNLTDAQVQGLGNSDIDRAIQRAYQNQSSNAGALTRGYTQYTDEQSGLRAGAKKSVYQDLVNQKTALGRTL